MCNHNACFYTDDNCAGLMGWASSLVRVRVAALDFGHLIILLYFIINIFRNKYNSW